MSYQAVTAVADEMANRIAGREGVDRVLRSRLHNAALRERVAVLVDLHGPSRGREYYDQRIEIPVVAMVQVSEHAADLQAEHAARRAEAETLLHEIIASDLGPPWPAEWTYAWQGGPMNIALLRPDLGRLYACAVTRVGFSVPST